MRNGSEIGHLGTDHANRVADRCFLLRQVSHRGPLAVATALDPKEYFNLHLRVKLVDFRFLLPHVFHDLEQLLFHLQQKP